MPVEPPRRARSGVAFLCSSSRRSHRKRDQPVGGYDFTVTLADDEHVVLTASGVILEGDMTYDFVLMGQPGDENHPLELRPLVDTPREDGTPTP